MDTDIVHHQCTWTLPMYAHCENLTNTYSTDLLLPFQIIVYVSGKNGQLLHLSVNSPIKPDIALLTQFLFYMAYSLVLLINLHLTCTWPS